MPTELSWAESIVACTTGVQGDERRCLAEEISRCGGRCNNYPRPLMPSVVAHGGLLLTLIPPVPFQLLALAAQGLHPPAGRGERREERGRVPEALPRASRRAQVEPADRPDGVVAAERGRQQEGSRRGLQAPGAAAEGLCAAEDDRGKQSPKPLASDPLLLRPSS